MASWHSQLEYIREEDGSVKCHLLRQECLGEDVDRYFDVRSLAERNVSRQRGVGYERLYSDEARRIVSEWYAEEIEYFGFDFNGPARRNVHYADT